MNLPYPSRLIPALVLGALLWPAQARAQAAADTLVVEWESASGDVIVNALRDAILGDTTATGERVSSNRVYKLERGGFYWITDRITTVEGLPLTIVGATSAPAGEQDFGPAILQRVNREGGDSPDGAMFETYDDFTLKNVWVMGQTDAGVLANYEPIALNGNGKRHVFDNVIFDRNDWHHLGPNGENSDFIIRNSKFRNLFGPTQIWEGLGIRLEAGADSVIFENNTFLNIGFTPFQSEAAPANYLLFNHNTFVNVGRGFSAGNAWKEAYVANNVFVNPFWQGTSYAQYNMEDNPDRDDPYDGFFTIGQLPARFGTNLERRVVLANNSYWRDDRFNALTGPDGNPIRPQPLVNDTTMGWFDQFDAMVIQDNYVGVRPNLATYPVDDDLYSRMINTVMALYSDPVQTISDPSELWYYDPGREEDCFVCNNWPLPEDFSYTNETLLAGGTDGLPLGDLNWFPDAKETYLANRDEYVTEVEELAGGVVEVNIVATEQAEAGTTNEDASVESVEGFTSFFMEGGGSITWSFTVPEDGTYGLNVLTNLRAENQRGQNIRVNGTGLRNNEGFGEYYFCNPTIDGCANPLQPDTWETVEIRAGELFEGGGALTLAAGTHTLQITPSWGYQAFSTVEVVDAAGNVVDELTPPEATAVGVQEECEAEGFCAQGFQWVALGANGSVSIDAALAADGQYLFRAFYQLPDGGTQQARVLVDGEEVTTVTLTGEAGATTAMEVLSSPFSLSAGTHTFSLVSDQGGVNVDYVQVAMISAGSVATEPVVLPEGYALDTAFPNPTNGMATIRFALGAPSDVTLTVYDVLGRKVATLAEGPMAAGAHEVRLNARSMASGTYVYRLSTPVGVQARRLTIVR